MDDHYYTIKLELSVELVLAQRIRALEEAICQVLDGTVAGNPERRIPDGMGKHLPANPDGDAYGCYATPSQILVWYDILSKALEPQT